MFLNWVFGQNSVLLRTLRTREHPRHVSNLRGMLNKAQQSHDRAILWTPQISVLECVLMAQGCKTTADTHRPRPHGL